MQETPSPGTQPSDAVAPEGGLPPEQDRESEAPSAGPSLEQRKLAEELEASRKRVDELARAYQALSKDREEFKQRLTRERERLMDVERGNVALTLLEAIDELDRCLAAAGEDRSALAQGVRLIRESLLSKVQATGIERIQVVGFPYDPNTAEATDMELTAQPEEDQKVLSEVRAGYRLKDRMIRPARVKVAKYVPPMQA